MPDGMFEPEAVPGRRGILKGGAGLLFAFALPHAPDASAQGSPAAPAALNAYVRIAPDGIITITAPVPEMGQATNTALPLIVAEELDADWARVRVETAPVAAAYENPVFRQQLVLGSLSTRTYWMPLRTAGAQARRVLLDAAAARWGVPVGELTTEPSVVFHAASNRRLTYGEIASFATVPATLPAIEPAALKPVSAMRLLGRDVARWDVPAKSTGAQTYAIDVRLPGMLHATMARAPVMGSKAEAHNGAEILRRPGITHVIALDDGVAIVGERIEAVLAARRALEVTWSRAPGSATDSATMREDYLADARASTKRTVAIRRTGDAPAAIAGAARTVAAEYTTDAVAHAQLEPLAAVADVRAGRRGALGRHAMADALPRRGRARRGRSAGAREGEHAHDGRRLRATDHGGLRRRGRGAVEGRRAPREAHGDARGRHGELARPSLRRAPDRGRARGGRQDRGLAAPHRLRPRRAADVRAGAAGRAERRGPHRRGRGRRAVLRRAEPPGRTRLPRRWRADRRVARDRRAAQRLRDRGDGGRAGGAGRAGPAGLSPLAHDRPPRARRDGGGGGDVGLAQPPGGRPLGRRVLPPRAAAARGGAGGDGRRGRAGPRVRWGRGAAGVVRGGLRPSAPAPQHPAAGRGLRRLGASAPRCRSA
jgi:hypothetical protein